MSLHISALAVARDHLNVFNLVPKKNLGIITPFVFFCNKLKSTTWPFNKLLSFCNANRCGSTIIKSFFFHLYYKLILDFLFKGEIYTCWNSIIIWYVRKFSLCWCCLVDIYKLTTFSLHELYCIFFPLHPNMKQLALSYLFTSRSIKIVIIPFIYLLHKSLSVSIIVPGLLSEAYTRIVQRFNTHYASMPLRSGASMGQNK